MSERQVFTEAELPKGWVLLVGRTEAGEELATPILRHEDEEQVQAIVKTFLAVIRREKSNG